MNQGAWFYPLFQHRRRTREDKQHRREVKKEEEEKECRKCGIVYFEHQYVGIPKSNRNDQRRTTRSWDFLSAPGQEEKE